MVDEVPFQEAEVLGFNPASATCKSVEILSPVPYEGRHRPSGLLGLKDWTLG
jgi:hypothetical protein